MKAMAKWVRHNQGVFVSLIAVAVMMLWIYGCESKVTSLRDSSVKVNREELNLEIGRERQRLETELELLIEQAALKQTKLDRQDQVKQQLMDFSLLAAETGTLNPSGLVGLVAGIVGIGAVIDNRIKDKVIKNRPQKV